MTCRRIAIFLLCAFCCAPAGAQILTGSESAPLAAPELVSPAAGEAETNISGDGAPLEITADGSLEWKRGEKVFIARGNALAKRGDSSIAADVLRAAYSEKKEGGGMRISKISAEGNVILKSKDSEAFGQKADYDLDKGHAVMTGDDLRLVTPDQTITAREKFEYWVTEGRLAASGRAKAAREKDSLEADRITAVLKDDAQGQRKIETLEAEGKVVIVTPAETVTGAYGIYRASTNMAEMKGGVKITRGPNALQGERAEVDLTSNASRIFGNATPTGRVRGIFYPGSEKKN